MIIKTIIPLLFAVFCFFGCQTNKTQESKDIPSHTEIEKDNSTVFSLPDRDASTAIVNYSFLNESNVGQEISLTGLLQGNNGNWVLIHNPTSRGRVTFILEVSENLESDLNNFVEKNINITGILTNASSTWVKHLRLLSIANE